jgi:uncharacterized protein YabE (DUF348 family)
MKIHREKIDISIFALGIVLVGLIFAITMKALPSFADDGENTENTVQTGQNFVTVYDNSTEKTLTLKTDASTIADVLERANIHVDVTDIVEPGTDETIVSENFRINIYRAKPTIVIDGIKQYKIMTAASNPADVAKAAGIELLEADVVKITTLNNFLESGLPFAYTVIRAKAIDFNFYGQALAIRTGANTVKEFLSERNIAITSSDWLSQPLDTKIQDGLQLELYRQGKNTITINEEVAFSEQFTHDYSLSIGYRAITKAGELGTKTITYEIEMQDGKEISREYVSEIITKEPIAQQVTLGARSIAMKPLTKQMGRNRYTTPEGIYREETYYNLPMGGVMGHCGNGGAMSIRADGVKLDKDGYVIVAAHLGYYPRCSLVETSLGLGKVYDTGAFATGKPEAVHFLDIATNW